jgi:hypothetical protein
MIMVYRGSNEKLALGLTRGLRQWGEPICERGKTLFVVTVCTPKFLESYVQGWAAGYKSCFFIAQKHMEV